MGDRPVSREATACDSLLLCAGEALHSTTSRLHHRSPSPKALLPIPARPLPRMQLSAARSAAVARPAAFGSSRVAPRVQHASTVCRARSDSFMVEVEVGDEEPEDAAVRRYMKLVMQSRVMENMRARKTRETKIEAYKRRFRERCEMRKAGVVDPTYEELYTTTEASAFDDYFQRASGANDPDYPWGDGLGNELTNLGAYGKAAAAAALAQRLGHPAGRPWTNAEYVLVCQPEPSCKAALQLPSLSCVLSLEERRVSLHCRRLPSERHLRSGRGPGVDYLQRPGLVPGGPVHAPARAELAGRLHAQLSGVRFGRGRPARRALSSAYRCSGCLRFLEQSSSWRGAAAQLWDWRRTCSKVVATVLARRAAGGGRRSSPLSADACAPIRGYTATARSCLAWRWSALDGAAADGLLTSDWRAPGGQSPVLVRGTCLQVATHGASDWDVT